MEKNRDLVYSFEIQENVKFNFMLDDGTTGYEGIVPLENNQYKFIFHNHYLVEAKHNRDLKSITLQSNVNIIDTGVNENGILILGLGNPDFFRTHLNI